MAESHIHQAILAVMKEVGYVQKEGRNVAQNYKFAGEGDLIRALRPQMLLAGITVAVVGVNGTERWTSQTQRGGDQHHMRAVLTVRFTHAASGESLDVQTIAEGVDTQDKASYKALTGGYKYALRETFCIETGDDPDAGGGNGDGADAAQQSQAALTTGSAPSCPKCGKPMQERSQKATGNKFWGCTGYPDCRQTLAADAVPRPDDGAAWNQEPAQGAPPDADPPKDMKALRNVLTAAHTEAWGRAYGGTPAAKDQNAALATFRDAVAEAYPELVKDVPATQSPTLYERMFELIEEGRMDLKAGELLAAPPPEPGSD